MYNSFDDLDATQRCGTCICCTMSFELRSKCGAKSAVKWVSKVSKFWVSRDSVRVKVSNSN